MAHFICTKNIYIYIHTLIVRLVSGAVDQGGLLLHLWQGRSQDRNARMLALHGQPGWDDGREH